MLPQVHSYRKYYFELTCVGLLGFDVRQFIKSCPDSLESEINDYNSFSEYNPQHCLLRILLQLPNKIKLIMDGYYDRILSD